MIHKLTFGYKQSRDSDLISFAYRVLGKMKGNADFADAPGALGELEKILPEYQDVNAKSSMGDDHLRSMRKALRISTVEFLNILADYVIGKANGNEVILVGSGFELKKAKGTKIMKPIQELTVTIDRAGQAVTNVKRVAGAKAYIHQYTTDPVTSDSVWVNKVTTGSSYTFTGLNSKEKYWFQVIAVGANDQQTATTPVSRVIQ
jgi:hypothetical protein